jgi:hypothetical protein
LNTLWLLVGAAEQGQQVVMAVVVAVLAVF